MTLFPDICDTRCGAKIRFVAKCCWNILYHVVGRKVRFGHQNLGNHQIHSSKIERYLVNDIILINKYDDMDNIIASYKTLIEVEKDDVDFQKCYYRFAIFHDNSRDAVSDTHFGINLKSTGSLQLNVGDYMNAYLNHRIKIYYKFSMEEFVKTYVYPYLPSLGEFDYSKCSEQQLFKIGLFQSGLLGRLKDYNNTMAAISLLKKKAFEKELNAFLRKWSEFKEITDLSEYGKTQGLYLMVLDHYNQCYIGQSNDIRRRVVRHWQRKDYFTGCGIDMFKALDTTRLYVFNMDGASKALVDLYEYNATYGINHKYLLNVWAGGGVLEFLDGSVSLT